MAVGRSISLWMGTQGPVWAPSPVSTNHRLLTLARIHRAIVREEKKRREREREERKKSIAIRFTPRRRCLREPRPFRWPIEIRTSTQFSFLHIERKRKIGNCSLLPNGKRKDNRRNFCCTVTGRTEGISRMRYVQFFDVTQSTQHLSKMQIYGAAASAGRGIIRRERKMENHRRP